MSIQEHVILVNDRGKSDWHSGEVRRAHVTHPATPAFSSWLFNANGECLITRRALSKKSPARRMDQLRLRSSTGRRSDRAGDYPPLPL